GDARSPADLLPAAGGAVGGGPGGAGRAVWGGRGRAGAGAAGGRRHGPETRRGREVFTSRPLSSFYSGRQSSAALLPSAQPHRHPQHPQAAEGEGGGFGDGGRTCQAELVDGEVVDVPTGGRRVGKADAPDGA